MSRFDLNKMFINAQKAINDFINEHQEETFYAFAIDADMLCLNSEEEFQKTLRDYQQKYPKDYSDSMQINDLKYNIGNWEYQGFFHLIDGFDNELYSDHYHIPFEYPDLEDYEVANLFQHTPYHKAMRGLVDKLIKSKVFYRLNKTLDFKIFLTEHNY